MMKLGDVLQFGLPRVVWSLAGGGTMAKSKDASIWAVCHSCGQNILAGERQTSMYCGVGADDLWECCTCSSIKDAAQSSAAGPMVLSSDLPKLWTALSDFFSPASNWALFSPRLARSAPMTDEDMVDPQKLWSDFPRRSS